MKKTRTGQAAFLNACVLFGLLVFFASALVALFATSATERSRAGEAKPPALTQAAPGAIGGDGANCQYTITSGADTIVPGIFPASVAVALGAAQAGAPSR